MPNGAPGAPGIGPAGAGPSGFMQNNGRVVQAGGVRVLCVADVRGNLRSLNDLAKQARADYIVHTGDFGFYDESSLERIADKSVKTPSLFRIRYRAKACAQNSQACRAILTPVVRSHQACHPNITTTSPKPQTTLFPRSARTLRALHVHQQTIYP